MPVPALLLPSHVFTDLKAQTRRKCLMEIAECVSQQASGLDPTVLGRALCRKEVLRTSAMGQGVAILDLQSARVKGPLFFMAVLDHKVDFKAPDGEGVDLVAFVLSPHEDGPVHLQRIAALSRMMRDQGLCQSIREARDPDAIRLLLMSPEQRLFAA
ncbi:MAG: PTS sugar transporter subunit IIA [Alphaproteobacteria bacterium]|nr:PTS sugar transporter subunit IIA [Alphaproteobacteria bacterium]MCB9975317.1 PTS sugar transporter subunit IIA [Rhodospirillales bacterium]